MNASPARTALQNSLAVALVAAGALVSDLLITSAGVHAECPTEADARRAVEALTLAGCGNVAADNLPECGWCVVADFPVKA